MSFAVSTSKTSSGVYHTQEERPPTALREQNVPQPATRFCGETERAKRRAETPSDIVVEAPLPSPSPDTIQKLMGHSLIFNVNGCPISIPYGEVLQSFQRSYAILNQGRSFPRISIEGEKLLAVLGGSTRGLTTRFTTEAELDERMTFSFLQLLAKRYLRDHVPFTITYANEEKYICKGFHSLVNMPSFFGIVKIVVNEGMGLSEKALTATQFFQLPAMRQNMEVHCEGLFRELYGDPYKLLGPAIAKQIGLTPNGLRCSDFQFIFSKSDSRKRGFTFQDFSLNLAPWLSGTRQLQLEGTPQARFDLECQIVRFKAEPHSSDFCDYWLLVAQGYRGVDAEQEAKLEQCFRQLTEPENIRLLKNVVPLLPPDLATAFLFNVCTHLSALGERIWHHFNPQQPFTNSLTLATMELVAFRLLAAPISERRKSSLCPYLDTHNGKIILDIKRGPYTLLLPLQPVRALQTVMELAHNEDFLGALLPITVSEESPLKKVPIDDEELLKLLLRGCRHSNHEVRKLCHDLLLQLIDRSFTKEVLKCCIEAFSEILNQETNLEERVCVASLFFSKLGAHYDHSQEPLEQLVRALVGAKIEFLPLLAVELWQGMSASQKKKCADLLFETFITSSPLVALKVAKQGVAEGCWENGQVERVVDGLRPQRSLQNGERAQLLYGLADLMPHTAAPRTQVFVRLNEFFEGDDLEGALTFARACEEKQLLRDDSISTSLNLAKESSEVEVAQQLQKLFTGLQGNDSEVGVPVYLRLFHTLVQRTSQEARAATCKTWVLAASVATQPLLEDFTKARLLTTLDFLNCALEADSGQALRLCRYAREHVWKESDYPQHLEQFLKLHQHVKGDEGLRTALMEACNTQEQWVKWLVVLPEIIEHVQSDKKKFFQLFQSRVKGCFDTEALSRLNPTGKPREFREKLVKCFMNTHPVIALALWERLPQNQRKSLADALLGTFPNPQAVAVVSRGIQEKYWDLQRTQELIRKYRSEPLLWDFIDTEMFAVEIVNAIFEDGNVAKALALILKREWGRAAFISTAQHISLQTPNPAVFQKLHGEWQKEDVPAASSVYMHLFQALSPTDEMCCSWIHWTLEGNCAKVKPLIVIFRQRKLFDPSPEFLLTSCLKLKKDKALEALKMGFWKQEDYERHFTQFYQLYQLTQDKELRKSLLEVQPEHATLLADEHTAQWENLKEEAETSSKAFCQLIQFAQSVQETDVIPEMAGRLLPTIWQASGGEQFELLEALRGRYPQVSIRPALASFPAQTASPANLKRFADCALATPDPVLKGQVTTVMRRLSDPKHLQTVVELLQAYEVTEDYIWQSCLQRVLQSQNATFHLKAWEMARAHNLKLSAHERITLLLKLFSANVECQEELRRFLKERAPEQRHLELLLEEGERLAPIFDAVEELKGRVGLLPDGLNFRYTRCAFRTETAAKCMVLLKAKVLSVEQRQDLFSLGLVRVKEDVEFYPILKNLSECLCESGLRGSNGLALLRTIILGDFPSLERVVMHDMALEMGLHLPLDGLKKDVSDVYQKLIEADFSPPRRLQLLLHAASFLKEEFIASQIIVCLENPQYDPDWEVLNKLLPQLSFPLQLQCLDKALDRFFQAVFDPSCVTEGVKDFIKVVLNIQSKHFVKLAGEESKTISPGLRSEIAGQLIGDLSPSFLLSAFVRQIVTLLTTCTLQRQLEQKTQIPMTTLNQYLQTCVRILNEKHPHLHLRVRADAKGKLDGSPLLAHFLHTDIPEQPATATGINRQVVIHKKEKPTEAQFQLACLLVDKCLALRPQEAWAQSLAVSLISQTLKVLIVDFPTRQSEWMPRFFQFVLCSNGHNREYYNTHILDFQSTLALIVDSVPRIEDHYANEIFWLRFYFDYKLPSVSDLWPIEKQIELIDQLLNRIWSSEALRSTQRAPALLHTACLDLFHHREERFIFWYNRLIDLVKSLDFSNRGDHLIGLQEDLSSKGAKRIEACVAVHKRRWQEIVELFADYLKKDADPDSNLEYDLFAEGWDYLEMAQLQFGLVRRSPEFLAAQNSLLVGVQRWHARALAEGRVRARELDTEVAHCQALRMLKVSETPSSQLLMMWRETMEQLIVKFKIVPLEVIEEKKPFTGPFATAFLSDSSPFDAHLHRCLINFWEEGLSLFVQQGDCVTYLALMMELGKAVATRLSKQETLSWFYFEFILNRMLNPFPNETNPLRLARAAQLVGLFQLLCESNAPAARRAALFFLGKESLFDALFLGYFAEQYYQDFKEVVRNISTRD